MACEFSSTCNRCRQNERMESAAVGSVSRSIETAWSFSDHLLVKIHVHVKQLYLLQQNRIKVYIIAKK